MSDTVQDKIREIVIEATEKCNAIIDEEVKSLFENEPGRYGAIHRRVGWLNFAEDALGRRIMRNNMPPTLTAVMELIDYTDDSLGSENRSYEAPEFSATDEQRNAPVAFLNLTKYPDGTADGISVYVCGFTDMEEEGIPGHDIRVRPVSMGPGEYTMVTDPERLETENPDIRTAFDVSVITASGSVLSV